MLTVLTQTPAFVSTKAGRGGKRPTHMDASHKVIGRATPPKAIPGSVITAYQIAGGWPALGLPQRGRASTPSPQAPLIHDVRVAPRQLRGWPFGCFRCAWERIDA